MVGAIQLSIMLGAAFGGLLLDHISVAATFGGGTVLLVLASLVVGNGKPIMPRRASLPTKAVMDEVSQLSLKEI
jgi:predicted MFS family arabinose efflux permease